MLRCKCQLRGKPCMLEDVDKVSFGVRPMLQFTPCCATKCPCCIHSCTAGVRTIAPNGFMNGTAEEEQNDATEDVYPDGPLQSGTQSLRRIKPKSKVLLYIGMYRCNITHCS